METWVGHIAEIMFHEQLEIYFNTSIGSRRNTVCISRISMCSAEVKDPLNRGREFQNVPLTM